MVRVVAATGPACQEPGGLWEDEVDHIDVEGLRIAYRQAGEGPALVLRHPELPRTLVLASAYAGWAGSLPPEEVEQRRQRALREIDLPPEQWVRGYLPGLFT